MPTSIDAVQVRTYSDLVSISKDDVSDAPRRVTPRELLERVDELTKTLDDNIIDLEF